MILAQRPDIQAKAQAEVDGVVGRETSPKLTPPYMF